MADYDDRADEDQEGVDPADLAGAYGMYLDEYVEAIGGGRDEDDAMEPPCCRDENAAGWAHEQGGAA